MNDDTIMAATRDASWYEHPDVTTPKVYHIMRDQFAACAHVLLVDGVDATLVPEHMRCRRAACRNRWPIATKYMGKS